MDDILNTATGLAVLLYPALLHQPSEIMSTDDMIQDDSKKLSLHTILSLLTVTTGLVLLAYMISEEGEFGAIPLLLILFGTGWYFFTRARVRPHHK